MVALLCNLSRMRAGGAYRNADRHRREQGREKVAS
jgi:hypothetical protein